MKDVAFEDTILGKIAAVILGGAAVVFIWMLRLFLAGGIVFVFVQWARLFLIPLGLAR